MNSLTDETEVGYFQREFTGFVRSAMLVDRCADLKEIHPHASRRYICVLVLMEYEVQLRREADDLVIEAGHILADASIPARIGW